MMKLFAFAGILATVNAQAACDSDANADGTVSVDDLLLLLSSFGQSCIVDESCDTSCDAPVNLDQLAGVTAMAGPGVNDRGDPASVIDMDHTPGNWVNSPTADFDTCAEQAYVTIDLGADHTTTGTTVWHYYGGARAYCSQKIAMSATGEFAGEEIVVMDTGTCSGWCSFPITCGNAEAGDCTTDNYGPTEAGEGNAFTWTPTSGRYVRHWSGRGQNSGVHFMEIDVYGCEGVACAEDVAGGDTGVAGISAWTQDNSMVKQSAEYDIDQMAYTANQNSITVDGDLNDWSCSEYIAQTPFIPTGTQSPTADPVIFDEYAGGIWNGPSDHSVAVAFNWNPTYLFLGVKVIDDTHQLTGASGWNGDSMQVVFADDARTTVTHLYNYAWDDAGGSVVHHHELGADGTEAVVTRYDATSSSDAATTYEVQIPATAWGLPANGAAAGLALGIGICVNDGDTEAGQDGQKGWSGWGPYAAVYGKTASATGVVTLDAGSPEICSDTTSAAVGQGSSALNAWTPAPANRDAAGVFSGLTAECGGIAGTNGCPTMTYAATRQTIAMDGDLGDWTSGAAVMGQTPFLPTGTGCCGGVLTLFDEYAGGIWNGIEDHSFAFSMSWDSQALYMGFKVVDDTHQLTGASGWNGDSIQVVMADAARTSVTHLYNYAIAEDASTVTHHESGPAGTEAQITRYNTAGCMGANCGMATTIYELKFPAACWGLGSFAGGEQAGVGLTINDGDTEAGQGGQKGWSGWGPYSAVYGKNAEECGLVTLA
jgi:hypothetical protein